MNISINCSKYYCLIDKDVEAKATTCMYQFKVNHLVIKSYICVFREFLEFKQIVRRFKDCIKTGDGVRAKKSRYPYPQLSYLENVI